MHVVREGSPPPLGKRSTCRINRVDIHHRYTEDMVRPASLNSAANCNLDAASNSSRIQHQHLRTLVPECKEKCGVPASNTKEGAANVPLTAVHQDHARFPSLTANLRWIFFKTLGRLPCLSNFNIFHLVPKISVISIPCSGAAITTPEVNNSEIAGIDA